MTHPLTPREMELKPCPFCGGEAWLNDYEAKYSDLPPKSRSPQCRSCGASLGYLTTPAKATEAWNRRATLASGSGDHAELARSVGKAIDANIHRTSRLYSVRTGERRYGVGGQAAATDAVMAVVSPLLAENAALRVSLEKTASDFREVATAHDEAERKLAEADQVIRDIAETPYSGSDWPRSRAATYIASKEAERG